MIGVLIVAVSDAEWRAGIRSELAERYGPSGALAVDAWSQYPGELVPEVLELVERQRPGRVVAVMTNATAAGEFGMRAHLYRSPASLEEFLDALP